MQKFWFYLVWFEELWPKNRKWVVLGVAAPPGSKIVQILMPQNLYFTKLYNIPNMINYVGSAKKAQSTFEIFGKMT